jgi:hypothetical protein
MSYLIDYKGVKIRARSAEEAADLARKLTEEEKTPKPNRTKKEQSSQKPEDQIASLWPQLDVDAKRVLTVLASKPEGVVTDELAGLAKVDSTSLKYILRKIQTRAKSCRLTPQMVIESKRIYVDRQPKSRYRMSEAVIRLIRPFMPTPPALG